MGRGALTLFPVCAATGAQGGAAAQASGLGAVPPQGGTAGALRAPAAPPGSAPSAALCKPQAYGPQAKPPLQGRLSAGFARRGGCAADPAALPANPHTTPAPPRKFP